MGNEGYQERNKRGMGMNEEKSEAAG